MKHFLIMLVNLSGQTSHSVQIAFQMHSFLIVGLQTQFQKSWDTVQIVNKKGMQ